MKDSAGKSAWLLGGSLGLMTLGILALFTVAAVKLHAARTKPLPVYGTVADFTLTDQDAKPFSLAALRGHVWVADIIFTRCPGPCLKMTRQMRAIQQALPAGSQARLVSFTTDPDFDTPPVLKKYAGRFGAEDGRWTFLTGTKQQLASVAANSLKLAAVSKGPEERQSPEDLFIHSTLLVLVDQRGQLRGIYETTGDGIDPRQVQTQIVSDLNRLESE